MEKYSAFRDPGTGIQPFLAPVPPLGSDLPAKLLLPIAYLLGTIRTTLVLVVALLSAVVVHGVLLIFAVVPPLHRILRRIFVALFARTALLLVGVWWIPVEVIARKRGKTYSESWAPGRGDIIVSNWESWIEILWLAFRFDPQFVLPVVDPPRSLPIQPDSAPVTSTPGRRTGTGSAAISSPATRAPSVKTPIRGWRRVSLLTMLMRTGAVPPYDIDSGVPHQSLDEIRRTSSRPLVVFPECTTSNGRGLLRFANVFKESAFASVPVMGFKVWVVCVRYDLPTALRPTLSRSIASASLNPLPHVFALAGAIAPHALSVRLLPPAESPSSGAFLLSDVISGRVDDELAESCAVLIAQLGKMKRVGMGWEDKAAFLELYRQKRK